MVVFEFAVPADEIAFGEALRAFPEVVVECERLVPTNGRSIPYLWATDGGTPEFADLAADDPSVEGMTRVAAFEEGALYRVEWQGDDGSLLQYVANTHEDVTLLQAEGHADEWTMKLRFPSRAMLSGFRAFYQERNIDVRVVRLYDLSDPKMGEFNVSEKQREALVRAAEMGLFEIPREATLGEVAESLGISPRAVSERLRRGQTNLINNSLTIGQPSGVGLGEG